MYHSKASCEGMKLAPGRFFKTNVTDAQQKSPLVALCLARGRSVECQTGCSLLVEGDRPGSSAVLGRTSLARHGTLERVDKLAGTTRPEAIRAVALGGVFSAGTIPRFSLLRFEGFDAGLTRCILSRRRRPCRPVQSCLSRR